MCKDINFRFQRFDHVVKPLRANGALCELFSLLNVRMLLNVVDTMAAAGFLLGVGGLVQTFITKESLEKENWLKKASIYDVLSLSTCVVCLHDDYIK